MRNVAVVLFLVLMSAAAELSGMQEVIFPEAGALCVGLWLMPKAVWNVRTRQVPLLLTVAALIGLAVNLLLPFGFGLRFLVAFCLVSLLLHLVRCNMYPVVSAAMLPVLMGTTSWVYPASVLVLSSLLAVGRWWLPQETRPDYHPYGLKHWLKLAVALCLFLMLEAVVGRLIPSFSPAMLTYMSVPPLVVTMIEFANRRSGFHERTWTIWGLIVVAAAVGTLAEWGLHRTLGLPMAMGVLVSAGVMLLLFRRFKPFAPALAIAMVPLLLPIRVLLWFPLLAAVGAAYFILVGKYLSTR